MIEAIAFERRQRLRLRPSGHDREIAVDVVAVQGDALWVQLGEPALWLEDHHLEGGVELAFWKDGTRHVAESVSVLAFDLDRGRIHLRRPPRTVVVQRRKTFREAVEVPVRVAPVHKKDDVSHAPVHEVITQDVGGGGLCLRCPGTLGLSINDEVQLELALPRQQVRARGRVRWAREDEDGRVRLGLAFTRITEREQDFVYGFLFDVQRSRLRATS